MDSTAETLEHIGHVQDCMAIVELEIAARALVHDASKLESPEKEHFDRETPMPRVAYGGVEYIRRVERLKPALEHHYAKNRHHPEHFENGIRGMDLIDLMEMVCDWFASAKRNAGGDPVRSVNICQKKFGFSDELRDILLNTVEFLRLREAEDARRLGVGG